MKIKVTNYVHNKEVILEITDENQKAYARKFAKEGDCRHDCLVGSCPLSAHNNRFLCISYPGGMQGKIEILEDVKPDHRPIHYSCRCYAEPILKSNEPTPLCNEEREILLYLFLIEHGAFEKYLVNRFMGRWPERFRINETFRWKDTDEGIYYWKGLDDLAIEEGIL